MPASSNPTGLSFRKKLLMLLVPAGGEGAPICERRTRSPHLLRSPHVNKNTLMDMIHMAHIHVHTYGALLCPIVAEKTGSVSTREEVLLHITNADSYAKLSTAQPIATYEGTWPAACGKSILFWNPLGTMWFCVLSPLLLFCSATQGARLGGHATLYTVPPLALNAQSLNYDKRKPQRSHQHQSK